MPDLFDTSGIRDDDEHWDAVAERIASAAARASSKNAGDWLAQSHASWMAACLLLAAATWAWFSRPPHRPDAEPPRAEWSKALAPADDVGRAIIVDDVPPAIGTLLLGGRGGG